MKTLIEVTKDHIDRGWPEDAYANAVSRAIKDHVHDWVEVSVGKRMTRLSSTTKEYSSAWTPAKVIRFLNDSQGCRAPFSFDFNIPECLLKSCTFTDQPAPTTA